MDYEKSAQQLKAIAEPNRMKIIDLLSCGTMCACDVLAFFNFSQPTLSHHMKVLETAGIVNVTKDSKWHYYTLDSETVAYLKQAVGTLFESSEDCPCQKIVKTNACEKVSEGEKSE